MRIHKDLMSRHEIQTTPLRVSLKIESELVVGVIRKLMAFRYMRKKAWRIYLPSTYVERLEVGTYGVVECYQVPM